MKNLYNNPRYYEIAFSFRDIPGEVNVFEEGISLFSKIQVKDILEIGCGNSPHMIEILKRGYNYFGIDLSQEMLEYSRNKANQIGKTVNIYYQNMVDFEMEHPVDYVYIALNSLYVKNTPELISHFDSTSRILRNGGLYLLDWCIQFNPLADSEESWEMERDDIKVNTKSGHRVINRVEQTYEELIEMDINDHGKQEKLIEQNIKRAIYPQEFLFFISNRDDFEFVGWWNDWDLKKPLLGTEKINRPIIIVRKK